MPIEIRLGKSVRITPQTTLAVGDWMLLRNIEAALRDDRPVVYYPILNAADEVFAHLVWFPAGCAAIEQRGFVEWFGVAIPEEALRAWFGWQYSEEATPC